MQLMTMLLWCASFYGVETTTIVEHQINSSYLKEDRLIKVELPKSYDESSAEEYTVIYVLDGQNHHQNTRYITNYLAEKKHIPELIIVSIPHTGKRSRDYYAFVEKTGEHNKGADDFLNFLEHEVISLVESKYRVNGHRILSGHSSGGVFVINSLIKAPALFQSRFAFSPGLHHNTQLFDATKDFFRKHTKLSGFIYFNLGGNEFYKSQNALNQMQQVFEDYAPKNLRYYFERPEDDGHRTTPFIGLYLGLKRLYAPLTISWEKNSEEDFRTHFASLSLEFNTEVKPGMDFIMGNFNYYVSYQNDIPNAAKVLRIALHFYPESKTIKGTLDMIELYMKSGTKDLVEHFSKNPENKPEEKFLNNVGYSFLRSKAHQDAMEVFKLAVVLYPESANAHDSLGDGYLQIGDMTKAKRSYKDAVRLAKKTNHPQLEHYESKLNSH